MTQISEPSTVGVNDTALLQRFVASHDEAAFNSLVVRYGPMVLGICRRILHERSDADDAFQATFLLLALKAKRIDQPRLLGNWLFGVATRTSIGIRRSNHRRVVQEKRLMRILPTRRRDETKDADLRMMLDEQISKLPEKLRQVLVCCHLEGLTKREAAERLQINDSTIMQRLKKARDLLKRRLGARGAQLTGASLGTILVAVAVPTALSAGTAKAATVAASGKLAVAGSAAGMSKGSANVLAAAKLKLAASLLAASGLAVTGAAAVKPLVIAAPPPLVAAPLVAPQQSHEPTAADKKTTKMRRLLLSIIMYANGRQQHPLPPNLKVLNCNDPSIEYYGQGLIHGLSLKEDVAILAERPAPDYKGPILIGFADAHVESLPQAIARGIIARSQRTIQAAAVGQKPLPSPTTRPGPQAPLPPEIRAALMHNAEAISPLDVSWTKTGFSSLTAPDAAQQLHVDPSFFKPVERRVIWQSGKWYDWGKNASGKSHESIFDGTSWSHVDSSKPPRIETLTTDEIFSENDVTDIGLLDRAGIHLPTNGPEMKAHVAASTILAQLNSGALLTAVGSSSADGHPCVRLTLINADDQYPATDLPPEQTLIYDLDPAMNYAIRHFERRVDGHLLESQDNDQFQQLLDNTVWLPHELVARFHRDRSGSRALLAEAPIGERFEVTALTQQPVGSDQFVLKAPTGMDTAVAGATPGIETTAHTGVLAEVQSASVPQLDKSGWRWVVGGIAGIGALALAVFGIRRYRTARPRRAD